MPYFFIIHYSYFYWSFAVTVTIKKNVDVQASLEAKTLKYQIKRDLSGDVQWSACASVGALAVSTFTSGAASNTAQTACINFVKYPKLKIYGGTSFTTTCTVKGKAKLNGVTIAGLNGTLSILNTSTSVTTLTASTPTKTVTAASPNTFTVWVSGETWLTYSNKVYFTKAPSRNDQYTVMK